MFFGRWCRLEPIKSPASYIACGAFHFAAVKEGPRLDQGVE